MRKLNGKLSIISSAFAFLFLLFVMLFKSNVSVSAYSGKYDIYKFTMPDINLRMYDMDHENKTITPYSWGAKTVSLDFYAMLPVRTIYNSDGTLSNDTITYSEFSKIDLFNTFSVSGFKEQNNSPNTIYGLINSMDFGELYNLISYYDNFNSVTKKSFDSYIDKNNEYIIPDVLFVWYGDYSYMVEDLDSFADSLRDIYYNYENYVTRITEDFIISEKQEIIDKYVEDNNLYTEEEYNEYGEEQYEKGKNSVDITSNDNQVIEDYINANELKTQEEYIEYGKEKYENGFNAGQASIDITSNDEEIYMEAYKEGYDDGKTIGYQEGVDSIDLEEIKKKEYDRGFENGYNTGFAEGESSVDITSDNDTVIHAYIKKYNYHTDFDFNLNFELGYNAGINFVYNNLGSDKVVKEYVDRYIYVNKYHTNTQYIDNSDEYYKKGYKEGYKLGLEEGKEVVYRTVESDPVIKEYWRTKIVNGMKINFVTQEGEKVYLIKYYDVNYEDNGDFKIIIHEGQDTFRVETIENVVPGQTIIQKPVTEEKDYSSVIEFAKKIGLALIVFIATIGIILLLNLFLSMFSRKGSVKYEKGFAV